MLCARTRTLKRRMKHPQTEIPTEIADLWIDAQRIIHIRFNDNPSHGISEAKAVVEAHNQLAAGTPACVIADIRSVKVGANREARKYYVSPESAEYKTAMAMLVSSPIQRMLGNIFLKLNRPPYPTRIFNQEPEAIQWLTDFEEA